MDKWISYDKLSKKEKRKRDQAKRQTWGVISPVTRKPINSRAYNRSKHYHHSTVQYQRQQKLAGKS